MKIVHKFTDRHSDQPYDSYTYTFETHKLWCSHDNTGEIRWVFIYNGKYHKTLSLLDLYKMTEEELFQTSILTDCKIFDKIVQFQRTVIDIIMENNNE